MVIMLWSVNDRPRNHRITDQQEGGAASYKWASESYKRGRTASYEEGRGMEGATGGQGSGWRATGGQQQATGELLVHGFMHRATSYQITK